MSQRTTMTSEQLEKLLKARPSLKATHSMKMSAGFATGIIPHHMGDVRTDGLSVERKMRQPKRPNKTEQAYLLILRAQYPQAKITFEGIKLRIGDNCFYCPDFVVEFEHKELMRQNVMLVEVKGPHVWDDSKIKFKAAKEIWGKTFGFMMMQRGRDKEWRRIL